MGDWNRNKFKMSIKCVVFDCFGTVFDMSTVDKAEIAAYVEHVNRENFTPFDFPESWYNLAAHPNVSKGVRELQKMGYLCVTLSNGPLDLLHPISIRSGICWDCIIDPAEYGVYKPNVDAYKLVVRHTLIEPNKCLMVTANPKFGDIEGSGAIGMPSLVIEPGVISDVVYFLKCVEMFKTFSYFNCSSIF
jgi:FMN phosphatase YigB (HAD superfamily)